jgi:pimeloyl-ACP methyl ester carboxylesterase
LPRQNLARVTAAEWFAGGERIWYDPNSARVLTEAEAAATAGALRVFERDLGVIARDMDGAVALYVGGSEEDAYEHRQIRAARERVPRADVLTFPGGHLTTSEHPDLLAAAIRDIADRHNVRTPPPPTDDTHPQ